MKSDGRNTDWESFPKRKDCSDDDAQNSNTAGGVSFPLPPDICCSLFEDIGCGIVVFEQIEGGTNFFVRYMNKAAEKLDCVNRNEAIGKRISIVFPTIAHLGLLETIRRVYKDGQPHHEPVRAIESDGGQLWYEFWIYRLKSGQIVFVAESRTDLVRASDTLRISESKFKAIFDNNPEFIGVTRLEDGVILEVNNSFLNAFGYERHEVVGRKFSDLGLWPSESERNRMLSLLSVRGSLHDTELTACTRSGKKLSLMVSATTLSLGGTQCLLCIARDITLRKKTEQDLRESEQRIAAILEAIPDTIFRINRKGIITDFSATDDDALALPSLSIVGKNISQIGLSPEDIARTLLMIDKALEQNSIVTFTYDLTVPKGKRHFEARMVPCDEDDVICVVRDITESVDSSRALAESEARARAIINATSDLAMLVDKTGRIVFINETAAKFLQQKPEDCKGRCVSSLLPSQTIDPLRQTLANVFETGNEAFVEVLQNGNSYQVSFYPVKDIEGATSATAIFARDVTAERRATAEIAQSEAKFRAVFNNFPDSVTILNMEDRIFVDANDGFVRITGFSKNDFVGKSLDSVTILADSGERNKLYADLARESALIDREVVFVHRDGSRRRGLLSATYVQIEGKQHVVVFLKDIEKLRATESAFMESEERFRVFFESSSAFLAIADEDGRILWGNRAWRETVGLPLSPDIEPFDEVHPDEREDMKRAWQKMKRGHDRRDGMTYRIRRREGDYFHVETNIQGASVAGSKLYFITSHDITRRIEARKALEQSERKYRLVIENASEAIFITQDAKFKFCNPATLRILNCNQEDVDDMSFEPFIHPDDRDMVVVRHIQRLKGGEFPSTYSFRLLRKDGQERWVELSVAVMEWEGRPATLNFLRDITRQKELEEKLQQSQKLEAIGQLAGGVAHDFNNLLSPIMAYADMMLGECPSDSKNSVRLQRILDAANQAKSLTQQLLAFGRKQMLAIKEVNLNEIVRDFKPILKRLISERISLDFKLCGEALCINGDMLQIQQILLNLVMNAADVTPNGGIVRVRTNLVKVSENDKVHSGVSPGRYAVISVQDFGAGIPETIRTRIFEPFFTTKPFGQGTGLGLSTSHGIAGQHGGFMRFDTETGKGTTFYTYLPLAASRVNTGRLRAQKGEKVTGKVLVAEDNIAVRDLIASVLTESGFDVVAADPTTVINFARTYTGDIELLITDVVMPEMNGRELFERLSDFLPHLRVLYISGYTDDIILRHGVDEKQVNFMQKPFTRRQLIEKVNEVMSE